MGPPGPCSETWPPNSIPRIVPSNRAQDPHAFSEHKEPGYILTSDPEGDACCGPTVLLPGPLIVFSRNYGDQRHWTHVGCSSVSGDALWRPLCCRRGDGVTNDQRSLFASLGAQGERPLGRCRLLLRPLPPLLSRTAKICAASSAMHVAAQLHQRTILGVGRHRPGCYIR